MYIPLGSVIQKLPLNLKRITCILIGRRFHEVKLERTGITIPGQVQTIVREGMPVYNAHKKWGNLVITFQVKFPKALDENQKSQVKKLFEGTF